MVVQPLAAPMHNSNGEAARQAKKLAPSPAVGADFDSRVRAAIRKELALQPKSYLEAAGGCKKQPGDGKGDLNFVQGMDLWRQGRLWLRAQQQL